MQPLTDIKLGFSIYYLSENAVTLEFGHEISEDLLQQISSFNQLINHHPFTGFETAVPAYGTLSIFYDPIQVIRATDLPGIDCFDKVSAYLYQLNNQPAQIHNVPYNLITIPTCYGGIYGEDLEEVAALHNLSADKVIDLHSSTIYKVYMIGFVPGFAYLGGMSAQLATPRKPSPRKVIPKGSVGIAGEQTGIYPLQTPGGWQLIGRTPLTLFDATRTQPALLKAGDQVVFKPIDHHQFEQYRD
ncbi:5-oxoprolinase subunit PxpB [Mucilaginibacter polytrichastri]|uniref:Kinase A inhibitor n=1 Tax=Mucilaginibacter polytrichastri TaxID=1302689 RepID=A0A1Q5ZV86_9SPHI|nr:5-oxoprolinase subunit PxpB [Mucilaginibacter polytrichastri]OKS85643.1 Kinase A inhibitor [Mucilaginibacter polytrichastri]SFS35149.1 inhibitor of KinA [Mucilaginibacter polytrichastri]